MKFQAVAYSVRYWASAAALAAAKYRDNLLRQKVQGAGP